MKNAKHKPPAADRVQAMVLQAGKLLEDVSPAFASTLPTSKSARRARLQRLLKAILRAERLVREALETESAT